MTLVFTDRLYNSDSLGNAAGVEPHILVPSAVKKQNGELRLNEKSMIRAHLFEAIVISIANSLTTTTRHCRKYFRMRYDENWKLS